VNIFDQLSPWHRQQLSCHDAAEDAAFRRAEFERLADLENRQHEAEWQEQLFRSEHGMGRAEYEAALAGMREASTPRDPAAEYGSEARPVILVDGTMIQPPAPVRRSRTDDAEATIRRYHEMGAEMERIIARARAKQPAAGTDYGYLSR
jgi:hypothetical protein